MRLNLIVAIAFVAAPACVWSEPVFLQHRINDPLNLLTAIPAMSAPRTEAFQFQVSATHANVFSGGSAVSGSSEEVLIMDGEISQLEFRGQAPLGRCYTAAVDSRLIRHAGGHFDDEIEDWHDFFGLPDANRDESPADSLLYAFSNTGTVDTDQEGFSKNQTLLDEAGNALGDVWLSLQRPIHCQPKASQSGHVRVGVKLPIGNTARWGSGGQSALFVDWHSAPKHFRQKARATFSLGGSYSSEFDARFDVLEPIRLLGYGAAVFDYRWNNRVQSVLQFDFRSPTYESDLTELSHWGVQIHLGLRASIARKHRIELSFSEDAAVDTAPDIGVRFAYTFVPD